jgi:PAS domain S-box-containing protein
MDAQTIVNSASEKGAVMSEPIDLMGIFDHDANFQLLMKRIFQLYMQYSFDAIMITEAKEGYPIVFVNKAFSDMTGYDLNEIQGKSPSILQGPKTDPEVLQRLREDLAAERVFHGRAINYRKDGSEFAMEWRIAPIRNAEEQITHFLAIQQDVTHRPVA